MHQTLLVELFTEELPPKALKKLGDAFANSIFDYLKTDNFLEPASQLTAFASPRRLAAQITNVAAESRARKLRQKWMPVSVALSKDGKPSAALEKRLRNIYNSEINLLSILETDFKQEPDEKGVLTLFQDIMAAGRSLNRGLQEALDEAVRTLPVPKVMSYQLADGATTVQFVRPAHALVALHGANVVPVTALGLSAGRTTHGHRFQGAANIELKHADEYESRLEKEGDVVASFDKRKAEIESQLRENAEQHGANLGPSADYEALLDEVTALVERPTVYVGAFETEFLTVPAECLILTMKLNQKYFPLFDRAGKLSNQFLIVSNMRLDNPHNIIEGNQRVVRPRLSDARFFFETDKKTKLEERVPKLANVVYHNKLGNQLQRTERVQKLAGQIAKLIGADAAQSERGAHLAKSDLLTDMVGEFPELQGTMGRYYAMHDGEPHPVADAIEQHYWPKGAGGELPKNPVATAVMLADKLETLAGLFSIGQVPTGDKDPFALRRHALGVIRVLIELKLQVTLPELVTTAFAAFSDVVGMTDASAEVETFIFERLRGYLREQGYTALEVESVIAQRPARLDQLPAQLAAVREFISMPEAVSLAAANKRIGNILKKSDLATSSAQEALLAEPAERSLFDAMKTTAPVFDKHFAAQNYTAALQSLAPLKIPVDAFFENVMVNAEDLKLRNNRLALLNDLHVMMNKVADLSKLAA
jgi:glycyl-tRNA synthetase beta chain